MSSVDTASSGEVVEGWRNWSDWSQCSKSCGDGYRRRLRTCVSGSCTGPGVQEERCNRIPCKPLTTCRDVVLSGLMDAERLLIDPDGPGKFDPLQVVCNYKTNETVVEHDFMSETRVEGYQEPCSYHHVIQYGGQIEQVRYLVEISKACRQTVTWNCRHAAFRDKNTGKDVTYLINPGGEKMNYWGGAGVDSGACACGMTTSCADPGKLCNCDVNDNVLRTDTGDVINMADLPITEICAGGTGEEGSFGIASIGPLICRGRK